MIRRFTARQGIVSDPAGIPIERLPSSFIRVTIYGMFMRASGALLLALLFAMPAQALAALNVDVESLVRAEFADAPVMIEIARCESKFRQYTDAGNPLYGGYGGGMVGIFQVYADVHRSFAKSLGMDIETAEGNIAYARYLYDSESTRPWNSSMSCWRQAAAEIEAKDPANVSVSSTAELTLDLSTGMDHPQVRLLQQRLNAGGFAITDSGPGSPGNETTLYGALTRAAVQRFQCAKSIVCSGDGFSTGYGVFGPRTRAALLAHAGTGPVVAESAQSPVSEPIPAAQNEPQSSSFSSESAEIIALRAQIAELQARLAVLIATQ